MTATLRIVGALLTLAALPAWAADFTVVNSGSTAYVINAVNNPQLTLERGRTYTFAVTASGHPFWIKTAPVTGTGSAFDTGVTNNGTQSGTLTFVVPVAAPNTLFYNCQFHGSMSNQIHIIDPVAVAPGSWSGVKALFRD